MRVLCAHIVCFCAVAAFHICVAATIKMSIIQYIMFHRYARISSEENFDEEMQRSAVILGQLCYQRVSHCN